MTHLGGITAEEFAAQASRIFGTCPHDLAEPVVLSTGEVVASVCVNCLGRLPASWGCTDCEYSELRVFADPNPIRYLAACCPRHRTP